MGEDATIPVSRQISKDMSLTARLAQYFCVATVNFSKVTLSLATQPGSAHFLSTALHQAPKSSYAPFQVSGHMGGVAAFHQAQYYIRVLFLHQH